MERGGNFRGRGGRGFGRGRGRGRGERGGRGGRGSRVRGRGGGRGGRGNFDFQQRRHEEQGYAEDYVPPQLPYPLQQQQYGDVGMYPPQQQGYPPQPPHYQEQQYQSPYPPQQEPQQYQQYQPHQDQYQQPQFQQQGYADDGRGGYTNGNPPPFHQPMNNFETQPPPVYQQQYQQPPPPSQYQQPPPPQQQYQQFQDDSSRYAANPPMPPMPAPPQPASDYAEAAQARQQDYAEAAQARQQAYAPIPPDEDVSETQQASFQEPNQPPPPSYQQQPPLPPLPQHPRSDWNYPPQQNQQWQQPPPQQQQFVGGPPAYVQQGLPPRDQRQYQRDQNPRFQDRRQDRHDRQHHKPQQTPPPSYICHNCNQPGHWKQHCPLFAGQDDSFQQHYSPGMGLDQQWVHGPGAKPQDPRRYGEPHSDVLLSFAAKNEPRGQPPLPDGPAPPLPPNSQHSGNDAQPLPPQPDQQVWKCEPCVKSFVVASQYNAHVNTHVTCSDCDFSACKRVVTAHYETLHGQYSGQGLKEIDVDGQKFMVLVGNSAEDIAKWREERRKKWFAMSRQPKPSVATAQVAGKRKLSISSEEDLEEGEIEEDEEVKAQIVTTNATMNIATPDSAALHHDKSSVQEPPVKKQRKTMLCKWFSRGRCRFNEAVCKYSHDRSTFGCRAMMHKGSCSKDMYCPFSHDTAVLSGQHERSQKASKERATEQQWLGEQKSLLRKLLAKDVRVEQHKMLQIVHFLVENEFLRSTDGELAVVSAKVPAVKIEVLQSDEMSPNVHTEASESIKSASDDAVMEEASEQVSMEESNSAVPNQGEELTKVVADDSVSPVVEASACEQELPVSKKQDDIVPSQDDGDAKAEAASEEESVKYASSSVNAVAVNPEEVTAAGPYKIVELVGVASNSAENAAKEVPTHDQDDAIETSAGEVNEAC